MVAGCWKQVGPAAAAGVTPHAVRSTHSAATHITVAVNRFAVMGRLSRVRITAAVQWGLSSRDIAHAVWRSQIACCLGAVELPSCATAVPSDMRKGPGATRPLDGGPGSSLRRRLPGLLLPGYGLSAPTPHGFAWLPRTQRVFCDVPAPF